MRVGKIETVRAFAAIVLSGLALLCGCAREHYVQGTGDAGQFILQKALCYGGHPISTNGLPEIKSNWRYVQDELGIGIQFPIKDYATVDNYLRSTFGAPSSQAGWAVRDIGVAIYLQAGCTNTEVGIFPPMSEEQQSRMFKKVSDIVGKNMK